MKWPLKWVSIETKLFCDESSKNTKWNEFPREKKINNEFGTMKEIRPKNGDIWNQNFRVDFIVFIRVVRDTFIALLLLGFRFSVFGWSRDVFKRYFNSIR